MEKDQIKQLVREQGTPLFVYESRNLKNAASELLRARLTYGYTVRYALKANPHPRIIKLFNEMGLHFDASSTFEAKYLIEQGIAPNKISLSGQTLEGPLKEVISGGVLPVATSLHQIEVLNDLSVKVLAVRINPGIGSGHSQRTNVGGPASSFGIWQEYLGQVKQRAASYGMKINRLHTHIGSGADPDIWQKVAEMSFSIAEKLPDVEIVDLGGGYKVGRMSNEPSTNIAEVLGIFLEKISKFFEKTGRKLHLEIEPGTFLVANAGTLLARVEDIVDTGENGYTFLRLNTGMNDILRPSLYGAEHPIEVINDSKEKQDYVVVGHNCESGDILTPVPGEPEALQPRTLNKASIGDIVVIGGVGAYCAAMRATGYNGFPSAKEILI